MKHTLSMQSQSMQAQRGVMLIVALIMLLVMTLVGVTTMGSATLQERMAGNNRLLSTARLNAEAALRQAEALLSAQDFNSAAQVNTFFNAADDDGLELAFGLFEYDMDLYSPNNWDPTDAASWDANNSIAAVGTAGAPAPRFYVEYMGKFDDCGGCKDVLSLDQDMKNRLDARPYVFRITAIGYAADSDIFAVLEATYMTQQGSGS
ncbi:MAG: hypothetical protein KTR20_08295 [Cellvibrionaceae bacterium]|nr:hypothetical protein [Cellvibrionaceae bacterium]